MQLRLIFFSILIIFLSCSKKEEIYTPSKKIDPYKVYIEGMNAFKKNNFFLSSKKFSEAELNFTIPEHAAKSALMASFSLYGINFYSEAEENLKRYIKTYPADKNVIYAHYLLAMIYFEQIADEKKDLQPLIKARDKINFFLTTYPDTDYSVDLKFKKDLIINQLASKELYIAKFYISVKKWIPAINRLKIIVKQYDKTIYIEEALHRLVEIHYHIGLENEAEKYAKILGYNYNSSKWFEQSYKILNKDYVIKNINRKEFKKEKENFIKKIIKMIK